jgi:hypothetical protein
MRIYLTHSVNIIAEIEPDFKVPVLGPIQALIDKLDISALIKL